MNRKLRTVLAGVTAAAVLTGGVLAASSASAQPWPHHNYQHYNHYNHYGYGYDDGFGAGILGFVAGAFVGSALSRSYDDNSCYRFRTYNPATGMYMSYNGPRHCP